MAMALCIVVIIRSMTILIFFNECSLQVNTQDFGIFVFEENEDDISRHSIEDIKREIKYSDIGKLELWHFRYSIYSNHKNLDGLVLEITPLNFKEVVKYEYDIVDT